MKYSAGLFACIMIVVFIFGFPNNKELTVIETAVVSANINSVDTLFEAGKVYLNVQIDQEMTCKQAIQTLKIKPFTIKTRIYQPVCIKISSKLIRITYAEQIST